MELLRVENGNLYIVQGECQELRKKKFDVERLASENRELRERLSDAEAQLQAHHLAEITGSHQRSRPRTAAEVLEECEGEMDSELEELFRRNQTNLTHIKQEIAVMKGEQSTSLIDEAPTPVKAPQERDPDVDTPAIRRPARSTVPRPGTSEGRRLKCASSSSTARRPKTPSVADILRGVRDDDDDAPQWSDAIDRRTTATVSPDRVVATKHAYLLGDGGPSPSKLPGTATAERAEDDGGSAIGGHDLRTVSITRPAASSRGSHVGPSSGPGSHIPALSGNREPGSAQSAPWSSLKVPPKRSCSHRYQRHDAPPGMILIVDAEARAVSLAALSVSSVVRIVEPPASRAELDERGVDVARPPHPVGGRQVPRVDQQRPASRRRRRIQTASLDASSRSGFAASATRPTAGAGSSSESRAAPTRQA